MSLYLKRAIQDIRHNRFLNVVTIITIALSILIVSSFALFFINTKDLMRAWKEGVRIMVYLLPSTPESEIPALQKRIAGIYGIDEVRFIPKADALKQLKTQMKRHSSLLEDLKENPLPDAFEVRLVATSQNWQRIEKLALEIENLPQIEEVEYGQRWLGRFTNIVNLFTLAGYGLGALFFMAAVFFVANTIRLVLYSRRDEVEIMRLVGAEDRFIKTPFYIEGIIQGAVGGIIGLGALFIAFTIISSNVSQDITTGMFQIRFLPSLILVTIVISSMIVGWLGCFVSLKQFLKS
jgi:cell division transport system permease protein